MKLDFYKLPFTDAQQCGYIFDANDNFIFQFDHYGTLEDLDLNAELLAILNEERPGPANLNLIKGDESIFMEGESIPLLTIRGWGNLTGIGGYRFDSKKAAKIQDNLLDWIFNKLTNGRK